MLGNWSFGDYFKREAITFAWELLTKVYGINAERLYVTYHGGDPTTGLEADDEARNIWLSVGVPPERLLPFGNKDNFWEMGDQGPCGPCSEIHYDRIGHRDASHLVNMDDPDVLEIWNLVFIQYNREADKSLKLLPAKHVDTGMGLERVVSVLQNKSSNYDTDIFTCIFDKIKELAPSVRDYQGLVGADDKDGVDMAYRVVADHARTLTIALSDGGVPSNEGRGYVLRRILRRGVRYARRRFGVQIGGFFSSLVDTVVNKMGHYFPELHKNVVHVKALLDEEEVAFARTLDRGEKMFSGMLTKAIEAGHKQLAGVDAWRLYDTYGFPIDLTRLMAEEFNIGIDEEAFEHEREKSKEISKSGRKKQDAASLVTLDVHAIGDLEKQGVPKTNDEAKYLLTSCNGAVQALFVPGRGFVDAVDDADTIAFGIVLHKTNFYAEQGGQEQDTGSIAVDGQCDFQVDSVQVYGGYVLHSGYLKYGRISKGDQAICTYDEDRRRPLRSNHTATHILNYALKKVLSQQEPDQKGSLVAPEKLRFDFSCRAAPTPQQLHDIQVISQDMVDKKLGVYAKEVPLAEAKGIAGLRAVFGEVYPDPVRVISIGTTVEELLKDPANPRWTDGMSIEFCGGTHVANTSDIETFLLLEEGAIAKGIRRIVAVTGYEARAAQDRAQQFKVRLDRAQAALKTADESFESIFKDVSKELDELIIGAWEKHEFRQMQAEMRKEWLVIDKARKAQQQKQAIDRVQQHMDEHPNSDFTVMELDGADGKLLTAGTQHVKTHAPTRAAYLFAKDSVTGRIAHQCIVPKNLNGRGLKASEWASEVSKIVGGKSGGKAESAQGSGDQGDKMIEAMQVATEFARLKLSS